MKKKPKPRSVQEDKRLLKNLEIFLAIFLKLRGYARKSE